MAWNALFFKPGDSSRTPTKSARVEPRRLSGARARALRRLPHAEELLGGDKTRQALQGGRLQGWFAPNITGDTTRGVGGWSVDDDRRVSQDRPQRDHRGDRADGARRSPTPARISSDADLKAIAIYLKSLPGSGDKPAAGAAPTTRA